MSAAEGDAPTRLARRLTLGDAVVIGIGSMVGAGVFVAIAPAARAAGSGLLIGLAIAGGVAYCNATSSAQLAAIYPASGGTYVYGRERLGLFWGYLAGWAFIVGKTASCAAIALAIGTYAAPSYARPVSIAAVVVLTAVNYRGVQKTAALTRIIVAIVLSALALAVGGSLFRGEATASNLRIENVDVPSILRAAAFLFFAFAGYARIATLGEEVADPARTIPKAIPRALGVVLVIYFVVAISALLAVGPEVIARSATPLATAVAAGDLDGLAPAIRAGAVIAALGVLLSLIAGVSRTAFAMAAEGEMPRVLAVVHPRYKVPHRADVAVGAAVIVLAALTDLRHAIGFSSFCVLTYYAVANASAWTLPPSQRRWPRALSGLGLAGCAALGLALPRSSVLGGIGVLMIGSLMWLVRRRLRSR